LKKKRLLQFMLVLVVLWCALPALANTVTLNQNHTVAINWTGDLVYRGTDPDWTSVEATGQTASATASASVSASASGSNPLTVNLNQSMQGVATGTDVINLWMSNHISLLFYSEKGGDATLSLADTLSSQYDLAGGIWPAFMTITAFSTFTADVYSDSNSPSTVQQYPVDDSRDNLDPNIPLSNFTGTVASISGFDIMLSGLFEGEIFALDLDLTSNLFGTTAVPLPPAVWLFGSGLSGLLIMRRRFARGK
jgi:hypothetical protein